MEKMVKTISYLCVGIFILFLVAENVSAGDVAYYYSKLYNIDKDIVSLFKSMNLTVDLVKEGNRTANLLNYRLVYINDDFFRNPEKIPIDRVPTIISNYYHGPVWGITDSEGISSLGANSALTVNISNEIVPVYTIATDGRGAGVAIPYYFLRDGDRDAGLVKQAGTFVGSQGWDLGDVISYGSPGIRLTNGKILNKRLCFFGLIEAKQWTSQAVDLFKECAGFVGSTCSQDSDCPSNITSLEFCMNNDMYKNMSSFKCIKPDSIQSSCIATTTSILFTDCQDSCDKNGCIIFTCHNNSECDDQNASTFDECINPNTINSSCEYTPIKCFVNSDCNDNNSSTEDICNNGGTAESNCTYLPITCFKDSDCGTGQELGDLFCNANNLSKNFLDFKCVNKGTAASRCENNTLIKTITQCNDYCEDAMCKNYVCKKNSDCNDNNSSTFDECVNPNTPQALCINTPINCASDNDCGNSGFIGSEFCTGNEVFKNYQNATCMNKGTTQSRCLVSTDPMKINNCINACAEGACVRCDSDNDCNDNNSSTNDKCINPLTTNARCENTPIPIPCSKNSDCGNSGFFGDRSCSNKNIVQDFLNFTCINANTPQSYCLNSTTEFKIQTCSDYCSSGVCKFFGCSNDADCNDSNPLTIDQCLLPGTPQAMCNYTFINIRCSRNSQCNDGNEYTFDECVNPGTSASKCRNTVVNCISNGDCGVTGYIGTEFCSNSDVYKNYQVAKCYNEATLDSYCSIVVNSNKITDCPNACANGVCIRCNTNSDCNDFDSNTMDRCINNGTINSRCENTPLIIDNIKCTSKIDCGTDFYFGEKSCSGKNVMQNFMTFNCNNANTQQSYCSNSSILSNIKNCIDYCEGGICKDFVCENDEDCDDYNSSTTDKCINPKTPQSYCTHGYGNIKCKNNNECNDNNPLTYDECINPNTIMSNCRNTPINCASNSDCGFSGYVGSEFCTGNDVFKNYQNATCINPGTLQSNCQVNIHNILTVDCPNACANGVCIRCSSDGECNDNNANTTDKCINPGTKESRCENKQIITKCKVNSDCGTDFYFGVRSCSGKNVMQNFMTFNCNNANTPLSFCTNSSTSKIYETCRDFCANGACSFYNCTYDDDCDDNQIMTLDKCINPGTPESICTNIPIKCYDNEDCDDYNENTTDKCINPGTPESRCENTPINITCRKNSDCNDYNPLTYDECINPNTIVSKCENTVINCAIDNDCGFSGYVGSEFCTGNDVFKNYQNATCMNGGTKLSFCSVIVNNRLTTDCEHTCANGICTRCNINNECNDNNAKTQDICNNPGTVQSSCSNLPIECNSNAECGVNGFTGDKYCSSTSGVSQMFAQYTCSNPGTFLSKCSVNLAENLIKQCAANEVCENGNCITPICKDDSDCKDNTVYTIDTCREPGTSRSYCTHDTIRCFTNADCGVDSLMNNFCGDNKKSLFENLLTNTCMNPATAQSYCTAASVSHLKLDCPDYCQNGKCREFICRNDLDCNDNDIWTTDKCFYPSTPESYCNNEPVACKEAYAVIDIKYVNNYIEPQMDDPDMTNNVYLADKAKPIGKGKVKIPLTKDGKLIVDVKTGNFDVPGLHVQRLKGKNGNYLQITAYGNNEGASRESILFNVTLLNADIKRVTNLANEAFSYENPYNGICGIKKGKTAQYDNPNEDEIWFSTKSLTKTAGFCSVTDLGIDMVYIYYDVTDIVDICRK